MAWSRPAYNGCIMTAGPTLLNQLNQEITSTLALVEELRGRSHREEVPGWLWLRAARASWLIGDMDGARALYGRAAPELLAYALEGGRRNGNFEQYAHLALGAAWLADDSQFLAETGRQIDLAAAAQLGSQDSAPEALVRVGLLLTRMRVAWYRGLNSAAKDFEAEIDRRAAGLDAWGKTFWQEGAGSLSFAAIKSIVGMKVDAALLAIQDIDRRLVQNRAHPPVVSDLVDEEYISFVVALKDYSIPLPQLVTPTAPGALAPPKV